jgi:hypothetical protein
LRVTLARQIKPSIDGSHLDADYAIVDRPDTGGQVNLPLNQASDRRFIALSCSDRTFNLRRLKGRIAVNKYLNPASNLYAGQ